MITALSGIDHCARTALGWTVMWCRAEVSMKRVIFNEMLRNAHCLNLKTVRWEAAKHHWMVFAWSVNRNFTQTQKRLRCEFFPCVFVDGFASNFMNVCCKIRSNRCVDIWPTRYINIERSLCMFLTYLIRLTIGFRSKTGPQNVETTQNNYDKLLKLHSALTQICPVLTMSGFVVRSIGWIQSDAWSGRTLTCLIVLHQ